MTNSREPRSGRGNNGQRRRRKLWLLSPAAGFGGDDKSVGCSDCPAILTFETLFVDRIVSGEAGGRYANGNIKPHCGPCSHRQGQRRTVEICNARRS